MLSVLLTIGNFHFHTLIGNLIIKGQLATACGSDDDGEGGDGGCGDEGVQN